MLGLKVVDELTNAHTAQLLSYTKLPGCELGYLLNLNTQILKNGIR